ncbi:MAG: Do family serine endopeptidase [Geminicoccaceae bacterium]|nr:Do family serine endopeptidase [Geminicoccaceae bacterium]MCB9943255.1 Do family serine endopeptidase [Geminicoccaceae bacterium]
MSIASLFSIKKSLAMAGISTLALASAGALAAASQGEPITVPHEITTDSAYRDGYVDLVDAVIPAVVNVRVSGEADEQMAGGTGMSPEISPDMRDFFEHFFGQQFGQRFGNQDGQPERHSNRQHVRGEGSGFFIDADGHVVTNAHVVRQASKIEVVTHDGTVYPATLKGVDEKTDLAVLQIDAGKPTPYVAFADSDKVKVGERVVAVGNPFGLGGTVTSGIVSATGRELGAGPYDDFMQIDASINRGNSGGPTFNLDGQVVGVNSMIYSPSGGSVGIGFAIASNLVHDVVNDLLDDGRVERGWLGVTIQPLDDDLAKALELGDDEGVLVANVMDDSPAAKAGIQSGDVIRKIDGDKVAKVRDVTRKVAAIQPGTEAVLDVIREGEPVELSVAIGSMPNEQVASADSVQGDSDQPRLGLHLQTMDPQSREKAGVDHGLLITDVDFDSPASEKDIRPGDILLEADGRPINTVDDVRKAVRERHDEKGEAILLRIARNQNQIFVAVPISVS